MKLYLIDGNSYVYRAFFAIRGLTDLKGRPTNALFGFTNMLMKIIRDKQPDGIVVAFDAGRKTKRHDIYPEYKANRDAMPDELVSQIPLVKDMVRAMNIRQFEAEGYEADDLLAALAVRAEKDGAEVFVVSSDKDMLQMVTEKVKIYDPMKDKVMGPKEVEERFSVPPERVTEYMALVGDSSDNVPGVKGVGDKTAKGLLQEYKSLEELVDKAGSIKKPRLKKLITEGADNIWLSKKLVELDYDAPVDAETEELRTEEPDWAELKKMFLEFGFSSLLKLLPDEESPVIEKDYECVTDLKRLKALLSSVKGEIAFDTEATGTDPLTATLVGFSFMAPEGEAVYVPLRHEGAEGQIEPNKALKEFGRVISDKEVSKTGHNLKYDLMLLEGEGLETNGKLFDTMLASWLLNPERQGHSLESVSMEHLGRTKRPYKEVAGEAPFSEVPLKEATPYAAMDADLALGLQEKLFPMLGEQGMEDVYQNIEMPLIRVLSRMERAGVHLDAGLLEKVGSELEAEIKTVEQRIYFLAGHEFNINSPKQLGHVLFEELGLTPGKKKKTGFSTDVSVLEDLSLEHELPGEVLQYRQLSKLKNTYTDVLPGLVNPDTGRIHTTLRQTGTATGRLSSSEPNLQNIPVRGQWGTRIRECFTAEPGSVLISADYSQIELRVLGHMSGDEGLLRAFREDEDIHTRTALEIFGTSEPDAVSAEMRRVAKTVNFGVIYGISSFGLSRQLGIPRFEADKYIRLYFERHPGIKEFIDRMTSEGTELGYVSTLFGRRRPVPELKSRNKNTRMQGERLAMNSPVQGTAADIIKLAMIDADRELTRKGLKARMVLQVHDELLLEAPVGEAEKAASVLRAAMEGAAELDVPLKVELGTGKNWSEAH
jgi:DNA polymerase-1